MKRLGILLSVLALVLIVALAVFSSPSIQQTQGNFITGAATTDSGYFRGILSSFFGIFSGANGRVGITGNINACTSVTEDSVLTQDIVNNSANGVCLTVEGNVTVDCAGYKISVPNGGTGISVTGANVTIKNCVINETSGGDLPGNSIQAIADDLFVINNSMYVQGSFSQGITFAPLASADGINITNNSIFSSGAGAVVISAVPGGTTGRVAIENNEFHAVDAYTIFLTALRGVNLTNNDLFGLISTLGTGVVYFTNSNGTLVGNQLNTSSNGSFGSYNALDIDTRYEWDIDTSNEINGLPIVLNTSLSNQVVYQDVNLSKTYGQLICLRCTNVTYDGVTMASNGIALWESTNSTINASRIVTNDGFGINLREANYSNISNNHVFVGAQGGAGIHATDLKETVIDNNEVNLSAVGGYALYLANANGNKIGSYNNVTKNIVNMTADQSWGIYVGSWENSVFTENLVNSNATFDAVLHYGTAVTHNHFVNERYVGEPTATGISTDILTELGTQTNYTNVSFSNITVTGDEFSPTFDYFYWYVGVLVNDSSNTPLNSATVEVYNSSGALVATATTGADGYVATPIAVLEGFYEGTAEGGTFNRTSNNHTFNISATGYNNASLVFNVSASSDLSVSLSPKIPYNFSWTLPNDASVTTAQNASYQFTVTNDGSLQDNYTLSIAENGSADTASLTNTSVDNISIGSSFTFNFTHGSGSVGSYTGTIAITSVGNTSVFLNHTVSTTVTAVPGALNTQQLLPTVDVNRTQNDTFTYSTTVSCTGGPCANISAELDPAAASGGSSSPTDCGSACKGSCGQSGHGTIDSCSDGSACDDPEDVENISVMSQNSSTFTGLDTVEVNGTYDCYDNVDRIHIAYYNGSSGSTPSLHDWRVVVNGTCNGGGVQTNTTTVILDNVAGDHVFRASISSVGDTLCGGVGDPDFGETDDFNITVAAAAVEGALDNAKSALVAVNGSATPFYTEHNNPRNQSTDACLANMSAGGSCELNWTVNATGTYGVAHKFFVIFSSDDSNVVQKNSSSIYINISSTSDAEPAGGGGGGPQNANCWNFVGDSTTCLANGCIYGDYDATSCSQNVTAFSCNDFCDLCSIEGDCTGSNKACSWHTDHCFEDFASFSWGFGADNLSGHWANVQPPDCRVNATQCDSLFDATYNFVDGESICFNNIDDDNDGDTDCADGDCFGYPECAGSYDSVGDSTAPQIRHLDVQPDNDSASFSFTMTEPVTANVFYYDTNSGCAVLNATFNVTDDPTTTLDDYTVSHFLFIDVDTLGRELSNNTSYYYTINITDQANLTYGTACSNFTTTVGAQTYTINFTGITADTIQFDTGGGFSDYDAGTFANQGKSKNAKLKFKAHPFEFHGVDLSRSAKFDFSNIFTSGVSNNIGGQQYLGINSSKWKQMVQQLGIKNITVALAGTSCSLVKRCDDTATTCTEVTSKVTCIVHNTTHINVTIPAALGFSSYTSGASSQLNITDDTDDAVKLQGSLIAFYANYTNISSNVTVSPQGTDGCNITIPQLGVQGTAMTYNTSADERFYYNTTVGLGAASYDWTVNCSASGFDILGTTDTFTITADNSVPEFADYALLFLLVTVVGGFFYIRKQQ